MIPVTVFSSKQKTPVIKIKNTWVIYSKNNCSYDVNLRVKYCKNNFCFRYDSDSFNIWIVNKIWVILKSYKLIMYTIRVVH